MRTWNWMVFGMNDQTSEILAGRNRACGKVAVQAQIVNKQMRIDGCNVAVIPNKREGSKPDQQALALLVTCLLDFHFI